MSRLTSEFNMNRGREKAAHTFDSEKSGARRADARIKGLLDGSAARSQQLENSLPARFKWLQTEKLIAQGLSRSEAREVLEEISQRLSASQHQLEGGARTENTSSTDMMSAFIEAGIEVPQHLIDKVEAASEIPTETGRAERFYLLVRELAKTRGTARIMRLVATLAIATGLFGAFSTSVNARVDRTGNEETPSSLYSPDLRSDLGEASLQSNTVLTETTSIPATPEIQSSSALTVTKSFMANRAEDSVRMIIPAKKTITDVVGTLVVLEPNQPPSVGLEFTYLDIPYTATMTLATASTTFDSSNSVTTTVEALQVPVEPEYIGVVTTSGGAVNLREKPTTNSAVAGSLASGETLFVIERDPQTGWYKVADTDGTEKWVSDTVVAFTSTTENVGGSPVDANLRSLVEKITGVDTDQIDLVYPINSLVPESPSLAINALNGEILGSFQTLDEEVKFVVWQITEAGAGDAVGGQAPETQAETLPESLQQLSESLANLGFEGAIRVLDGDNRGHSFVIETKDTPSGEPEIAHRGATALLGDGKTFTLMLPDDTLQIMRDEGYHLDEGSLQPAVEATAFPGYEKLLSLFEVPVDRVIVHVIVDSQQDTGDTQVLNLPGNVRLAGNAQYDAVSKSMIIVMKLDLQEKLGLLNRGLVQDVKENGKILEPADMEATSDSLAAAIHLHLVTLGLSPNNGAGKFTGNKIDAWGTQNPMTQAKTADHVELVRLLGIQDIFTVDDNFRSLIGLVSTGSITDAEFWLRLRNDERYMLYKNPITLSFEPAK